MAELAIASVVIAPPASETPDEGNDNNVVISEPFTPPDGGLKAWLQVAASFALYFNHL